MAALWWPSLGAQAAPQSAAKPKPKVDVVQTVGCVERRGGPQPTWWLTRAATPTVSRVGVFNTLQVEEARKTATLGTREFELVGIAEFLDAEGLLRSGDRAAFTTPDQVNATGELRAGRTALVKGLLIEAGAQSRLNLLAVVGMAETCR
jgi:hypothetical protein